MSSSRANASDRESANRRMSRYRGRRAAREKIAAELRDVLEREPTDGELQAAVIHELRSRTGGEGDGRAPVPARAGRPPSAEARALETIGLAGLAVELRAAEHAEELFSVLMSAARGGDLSAAIFLASRVAPAARQRALVRVPEVAGADLTTAAGVEHAIAATISAIAEGRIDLAAGETLVGLLRKRLEAAEVSARASAYALAIEKLSAGDEHGMPKEIAALRRAFVTQREPAAEAHDDDAERDA